MKFLTRHKILFFILFILIAIAIMILTMKSEKLEKQDRPSTIKTEVKKENKILESKPRVESKVEPKKQNQIRPKDLSEISPLLNNIDFVGKSEPVVDLKPTLTIGQIMQEQKKIDTFAQEKNPTQKKEDWKVDYGVGLEDGAIEDLKTSPTLKREMINGKVGFSTSF